MKKKNLINLFVIILGVLMCFNFNKAQATDSVFGEVNLTRDNLKAVAQANTLSATTTSKVLGISKNRESGDYYQWNITTTGEAKTVWKIATYPSTTSNIASYNDLYYCLNASKGFRLSNGEMAEGAKDTYNVSYDMKDSNDKNSIISASEGKLGTNYNKILWILDNSYVPTKSSSYKTSNEYKDLMNRAGIDIENNISDLTEEQIEVVQQMAIWYFTNSSDENYHLSSGNLPSIYLNARQLSDNYYGTTDDGEQISGTVIWNKMNTLYKYFINNAPSSYSPLTPTLSLSATDVVEESGDYYIAGPFSLNKENVSITGLEVKLNNTTLASSDYLIVSSKTSTTNITDYNNLNTFYLKVPKTQITSYQNTINVVINGIYNTKTLTFMTNEDKTSQPVVLIENDSNDITDNANVNINLTEISVEKVWSDAGNQDGKRPESIKVALYEGSTQKDVQTLPNNNSWTYTWTGLLTGKTYTVKELNSNNIAVENNQKYNDDYTATYVVDGNKTTITNSYTPETIDINGTKTWDDSENQDRKRPESITVNLLANGTKIDSKIVTTPWTYGFKNLPKYENGAKIVYTIDEETVEGYTKTINGYNITNTYTPGKVSKTVKKEWKDNDNQDRIRPASVEVQLYKTVNGIKSSMGDSYKVTLNAENNWKYTWEDLAQKEAGKTIVYSVEEINVPEGYEVSYSEDTFTITNKHTPKNLAIQLQKIDEQGNIITSSEATFEIDGTQNVTTTTSGGILDLDSQKLLIDSFDFTYTIKETDAPIGYNGVLEELSVKIAGTTKLENGSYTIDTIEITDKNGNPLDNSKIAANYDSELNKVIIKIVNTKKTNEYSVKLLKVGEDGTTPISGAWFKIDDGQATLISETGYEIAKGTLSENGELNLSYKLEETVSPDGYIKIDGAKEVKINAKVELKDNEYQITEVNLVDELEGITISEENNVITIKVKNKVEITGKYSVVLRKVDENGNILTGAKFEVNGTEYELSTGEVTLLENKDLTSTEDINRTYALKETGVPEGYEQIPDKTIYIKAKIQKDGNNYKLIRAELVDSEGNVITDETVSIKVESDTIVIVVKNTPIQKKFDLALRKFITKVNDESYSREPIVDTSTIATTGTATYKHIKQPVAVQKGDVVTYTIRVYNEGELDGYVNEITDYLPNNLLPIIEGVEGIDSEKYKEEIKFNMDWLWEYSNDNGKAIKTQITQSDKATNLPNIAEDKQDDARLLKAYVEGSDKLDYIDVQIKCLVTDKAVSGEYLTNIAEITEAQDINGVKGDGSDSKVTNADISNLADYKNEEAIGSTEDSYIPGQEDDDDFEKLVVKEFDLALRKFITKVNETSYSRQPVVDTSKLGTTVDGKTITTAIYNHSKEPVIVETNDIVTYKIRIYNEGTIAGYANEITDDIPEGLEFLPNSSVNVSYKWKMLDSEGNETEDVSKAVMIVTDYLSDSDKNNIINAVSEENGVKTLSYKDVEVQFKVIAKAEKLQDNIIKNVAQISADSDRDIDSNPNKDEKYDYTTGKNEDDIDYEPIKLQYFDLALRKFITKVNSVDYNNRYPEIIYNDDGSIIYKQTKDPVLVTTNDVVIYTIRVYNEGEKSGYAEEITDSLPEGLEFIADDEINKQYGWKLIDSNGSETQDITKAVKFTTDYLKNELIDSLVVENGQKILSYKDVQIAFKVTESNMSDKVLINIAEISKDSDEDIDSTPGNNELTEDDIDREYVKVQYFDLSLKKWVTRTMVTYNGKTTTTKTGYEYNSDSIAKVDLVASKMKKTTVKFAYNIKVTNEGELPGYAYEVKDYIPKGLKFVAEDNKDWKELEDGTVVTEKLKNTLLNPGESATVEIILTWKNSTTNTGLKTNYAEISKDSADDIDSTPDNFNLKEDDIDDAQVILSIKTAGPKTYVGLILLSVIILAGGIFLIKKYVIKE